ncbi:putative glutamate--tRNA ligase, mitochondrial [Arctopsyche grandis]|uniref:putative glutamate--tRNA ligase, mitochondrial n=1 Tax=Arctopsyche grandis TaxID=121162 RepID=UPI00406D74DF
MLKQSLFVCTFAQRILFRNYVTKPVRVRFAPSPTGYLHLGGLRTALYNYLFALSNNGKMILRIEDTDQSRKVDGALEALVEDLEWAGIKCDEGPLQGGTYGPYIQSERCSIYQEMVDKLIENGSAYRCFCSDKRMDLLRREALRSQQIPKYDNKCRKLTQEDINDKINNGQSYCIRFKLSSDCSTFEDLVYGSIAYDVTLTEGDPVIMKSDGYPTYHLANVVDDHLMRISHVLRGVEWQISTTKHILLYKAFQWEPPQFGHLPLIMNADGSKLSKRQGDIRVQEFRKKGMFPSALINYISFAGGGFNRVIGDGIISYTLPELVDQFNIDRVNAHSSKLNSDILTECNRLELIEQVKNPKTLDALIKDVQNLVNVQYRGKNIQASKEHVETVLKWSAGRLIHVRDLISPSYAFLWVLPNEDIQIDDSFKKAISLLCAELSYLENDAFERTKLKTFLKVFSNENDIKFNAFMKYLRKILSGLDEGPGISEMMEILQKNTTIERLKFAVK